ALSVPVSAGGMAGPLWPALSAAVSADGAAGPLCAPLSPAVSADGAADTSGAALSPAASPAGFWPAVMSVLSPVTPSPAAVSGIVWLWVSGTTGTGGPIWMIAGEALYVSEDTMVLSCSTPSTVTIFHRRDLSPVWADWICTLAPGAREVFSTSLGAPGSILCKVSDSNRMLRFSGLVS